MSKPIASIIWPAHARDRVRLLWLYMLAVIEQLSIPFWSHSPDPRVTVKGLLDGTLSEEDRRSALSIWWQIVDEEGIQNFGSRDAVVARLAVCLLSPSEEHSSELGVQLSWFLEVLGLLGEDVEKAIELMERHFDFA
jgi:hypothetical protein